MPDVGTGAMYKYEILGADGEWREKADPMAIHTQVPPARLGRLRVGVRVGRRRRGWPPAATGRPCTGRCGSTRCTSARGEHWGGDAYSYRQLADDLVALRRRPRLHPRGAPARDGAPVRRLVGLPGDVVLRPDRAVRRPRRLPLPGRPAAPGRHRRHPRLGPGALPQGRLGAGALRRHAALRAPQPAARRAPRLGHLRLRLRPPRGAQLPGRQRAVLARGVPRRRAAGRRRRLDALPRLLARGRRVDAQHARRPREPRGGAVPPGDQRHRLQAGARGVTIAEESTALAGRHPADPRRRPGLRLQVEHGLDARHARLLRRRARAPRRTTTTR